MRARSRLRLAALGCLFGAAWGGAAPAQPAPPRRLALVGGMLLDGYEVPPLHHAAVLIEGERIAWVGRAADARSPRMRP